MLLQYIDVQQEVAIAIYIKISKNISKKTVVFFYSQAN